ncbi:Retrovirus-related Pol polyprotein from transposon TNT 1-94 [Fusarium oxysporum]|nr:Retrovirus-related Pol polyprotein from transposon TNT 1-94 [Fusarium oxysporum]
MSTGITPLSDSNICEACVKGRIKERPHRGCIRKGTRSLESLHGDVAGPYPEESIDGHRYWACFIDDFTKMTWVFPIKHKSEFGGCFRRLLEQVETPTRRCRYLRLDRAGENQADTLTLYCENKMIEMMLSATEQHEQNGVAEVANRVLLEKVTSTLIHSGLETKYWPYVLKAMAYVRNISPASGCQVTPYEAWHKEVPDLSHLRVIGSRGFAKIPSAKRKKMGDKTVPCRLLGYQGSTNYVLVDDDGKIFFANNVVFDEKFLLRKRAGSDQLTGEPNAKRMDFTPSLPTVPITENSRTEEVQTTPHQSNPPDQNESNIHVELGTPERTQSPNGAVDEQQAATGEAEHHPELRFPVRETRGQIPSRYTALAQQDPGAQQNQWGFTMIAIHLAMIANNLEPTEPKTFAEAMNSPHSEQWMQAMMDEIDSLMRNDTFIPVNVPPEKHSLQGKWVYKLKRGKDGEITRFKARFVVRGFEQKEGIDYHETFAAVVKPMSYKMIFAIAAALDLELEQMDVKTAFLYGDVEEEIYIAQPQGFDDKSGKVFRLRKALYGLKQSPRIWYQTLSSFLDTLGFKPLNADVGVFIRGTTYIAVYVDDLLIAGPDKEEIRQIKASLNKKFEMTDLGPCQYYLGMSIWRERRNKAIFLSQRAYVEKVLREFDMSESKPVATPLNTSRFQPVPDEYNASEATKLWYARAIGSLMYAMLGTRPDIAFAVSLCSRYLVNPTNEHVQAVKRIMRYLRGTINLGLAFSGPLRPLVGYTDSDWAGDHDTRRSTAGYVFNVGTGAISWNSKRQPTVALSSCEAEYMGQTQCAKEAIWLRGLLRELLAQYKHGDLQTTILYGDNQGAIAMAKNPQFHARTKHIDLQWHYVRERALDGDVELQYVPTEQQIADGLTKALPKDRFIAFRNALGISNP